MNKEIKKSGIAVKIKIALPVLMFLFLLCQCVSREPITCISMKDGKKHTIQPIWRNTWYEYYKQGLSCLEKGCFNEAIKDFNEAVKRRETGDQWAARTFDTHLIDYFPHREMGVAYYLTGKDENLIPAREELEKSLEKCPTDKALYYLEKVYGDLIDQGKENVVKPQISFNNLTGSDHNGIFTRTSDEPVIISGDVTDKKYIKSISIKVKPKSLKLTKQSLNEIEEEVPKSILSKLNELIDQEYQSEDMFLAALENKIGKDQTVEYKFLFLEHADEHSFEPVFILNSLEDIKRNLNKKQMDELQKNKSINDLKTKVSFKKQLLFLPHGEHTVIVKAENIMGKKSIITQELKIDVDRVTPMINVTDKKIKEIDSGSKEVSITGHIYDKSGVSSIFANNQPLHINSDSHFKGTVILNSDVDEIGMIACDTLGNQIFSRIMLFPYEDSFANLDRNNLLASNGDGNNFLIATSKDNIDNPKITIHNLKNNDEIHLIEFPLDIEITDMYGIKSVTINDSSIYKKKDNEDNKTSYNFTYRISSLDSKDISKQKKYAIKVINIKDQSSELVIRHKDDECQSSSDRTIIFRTIPYKAFEKEQRLGIVVLPFKRIIYEGSGDINDNVQTFQTKIINEIQSIQHIRNERRFKVTDSKKLRQRIIDFYNNTKNRDSFDLPEDILTDIIEGKIVIVGKIEIGDISNKRLGINKQHGILVTAKLIDNDKENPKIEMNDNSDIINVFDKRVDNIYKKLADKLNLTFPLLVGNVLSKSVSKGEITTDISDYNLKINHGIWTHNEKAETKSFGWIKNKDRFKNISDAQLKDTKKTEDITPPFKLSIDFLDDLKAYYKFNDSVIENLKNFLKEKGTDNEKSYNTEDELMRDMNAIIETNPYYKEAILKYARTRTITQ